MHFNYQNNRLTTTKGDSTYLGWLANNAQRPAAGLECMTTGSVAKRLILSCHTSRHNLINNVIVTFNI